MRSALLVLLFGVPAILTGTLHSAELIGVKKIWDRAPHNAFTDLTRFDGQFYCVFREAQGHVSPDGAVRVIRSPDGERWESAGRIELAGFDLRDPKICLTPENQLMILGGATVREGNKPATASQSFVTFSRNGTDWSKVEWAGPTNFWLTPLLILPSGGDSSYPGLLWHDGFLLSHGDIRDKA